jgi:hypothetical protein
MARHPQFGNVITEKKKGVSNFELQWRVLNKVNIKKKKIGFGKHKY